MDSSYVPFQLVGADEFDALEVAIAAAERSSTSSCKKSKSSILSSPASSSYTSCRDSGLPTALCKSVACSPFLAPSNLACVSNLHHFEFRGSNGAAQSWQTSCDSLHAAEVGKESSAHGDGYVHNGCDAFRKHSEGEPSCGLSSTSVDEGDAARFFQNAAEDAYQGDCRSNALGDKYDGEVNGSIVHPDNLDESSNATHSSNAGRVCEAKEASTLWHEETHSKPRSNARRLPSWQLYESNHHHKNLRPSGHTKFIQTVNSVDEETHATSTSDFPGDLCIDNSRLPWGLAPSTFRVAPKCKLPSLQFKGRIIYSFTVLDAESAAHELLRLVEAKKAAVGSLVPLGFDTEWKVVFKRGAQPRKVAVLQLCIDADHCNVFHVIHTGIPPPLRTILEDPLVSKVGVGAYGDAAKLFTHYNVKVKGVKDLSGLANLKLAGAACAKRSWSLASLTEELLGKQVDKNGSIRMGDWEVEELSEAQLQYAATDAFASLYLFQVLLTFPDPPKEASPTIDCNTH